MVNETGEVDERQGPKPVPRRCARQDAGHPSWYHGETDAVGILSLSHSSPSCLIYVCLEGPVHIRHPLFSFPIEASHTLLQG